MERERQRIAAYGLLLEHGRLLLCRLSMRGRWYQHWTLPGGGIDFGEHPSDAVVREFEEETGLRVRVERILRAESHVMAPSKTVRQHNLQLIYLVSRLGGELRNEVGGSTDLCEFIELDQIASLPQVPLVDLGVDALRDL